VRKKDLIFWIAAAVFLVAVASTVATGDQRYLFLLIAAYFLRPTLAGLGLTGRMVDERQVIIHYRSGNIAFAVMIVASVVMAVVHTRISSTSWEAFTIVVCLGLAAKTFFNVVLAKNYRAAGSRAIVTVGVLWGAFVLIDGSATIAGLASTPVALAAAAVMVALGWLAPRFPKMTGAGTFAVAFIFMGVVLRKGHTLGQAVTVLLVSVPLLLAAASLFAFGRDEAGPADVDRR